MNGEGKSSELKSLADDVYFRRDFLELYSGRDARLFEYEFKRGDRKLCFRSLKRPIVTVGRVAVKCGLFDLETPYGYGGPLANCLEPAFLREGFDAYREECAKQGIVCEFIRFHPFNPLRLQRELFDFHVEERPVVVVDLWAGGAEHLDTFSKTTRNIVRRARTRLNRVRSVDDLDEFKRLYRETMDRNNAKGFYYFTDQYFERLVGLKGVELLTIKLGGEVASSGFFLFGPEIGHYHLSANNFALREHNGNYALLDHAFHHARLAGCRWMMLGGGRTPNSDDRLLAFKRKFSRQTMEFVIAGLVFLPEVKDELDTLWQKNSENPSIKRFQLYRA